MIRQLATGLEGTAFEVNSRDCVFYADDIPHGVAQSAPGIVTMAQIRAAADAWHVGLLVADCEYTEQETVPKLTWATYPCR